MVAEAARSERRALVTGSVADFAHEGDLVLVFVLKRFLASGGAMSEALVARQPRALRRRALADLTTTGEGAG